MSYNRIRSHGNPSRHKNLLCNYRSAAGACHLRQKILRRRRNFRRSRCGPRILPLFCRLKNRRGKIRRSRWNRRCGRRCFCCLQKIRLNFCRQILRIRHLFPIFRPPFVSFSLCCQFLLADSCYHYITAKVTYQKQIREAFSLPPIIITPELCFYSFYPVPHG